MSKRLTIALGMLVATTLLAGCNALRAMYPSKTYETQRAVLPADLHKPAVLIVTKTNGFRHHEAIAAGTLLFEEIAIRRGWSLYHTESGAVHNPDDLARFDVVVWHNTSGDILNAEQKVALREWIEAGGGFVGVHGAGGDFSYDWTWYVEELIGAQFIGHTMGPQFQQANAIVENRSHPATRGLPASFVHEEEWYSFDQSVRAKPGFQVLVSVDETTYSPHMKMGWSDQEIAMGDHPVVWSHCVGRGRVLYSALGHQAKAYDEPVHQKLLEGAVAWAAGLEGDGCR